MRIKIALLIGLLTFLNWNILNADVPSVRKQIALYHEIFMDLHTQDFAGKELTEHVPKLSKMADIGYNYAEKKLREAKVPPKDFELLARFREETAHVIATEKLTFAYFKRLVLQIAFLLGDRQKKGGYFQTCEEEFTLYTSGAWKDINNPGYEQCRSLCVAAFPFCFEAFIFADNNQVDIRHFADAFGDAVPFHMTVIPYNNVEEYGSIACDPVSAYLLSCGNNLRFAHSFRKHPHKVRALREVVHQLRLVKRSSKLIDLALFLLTRKYMIGVDDIQDDATYRSVFRKWIDVAKETIIYQAECRRRNLEQFISSCPTLISTTLKRSYNYKFTVKEIEPMGDKDFRLLISFDAENKPGKYITLTWINTHIEVRPADQKGFDEYVIKDVSARTDAVEINQAFSLELQATLDKLKGITTIMKNEDVFFKNMFGNIIRLVNSGVGGELASLDAPKDAIKSIASLLEAFYKKYAEYVSDKPIHAEDKANVF